MSLSAAALILSLTGTQLGTADLVTLGVDLNKSIKTAWVSGTGTGKADLLFTDTRTLAASATEDLDLFGTLVDALGTTFSPAKIKALVIKAADGNTNDIQVGGASATQFASPFGAATDKVKVRPGGLFVLAADAGYAITSTTDLLKIANGGSGTPVTYDIYIIAASA